jgi:hypothetical protein
MNHFYDPLDKTYGKGLSDAPRDIRVLEGTNSFAWASISNCNGVDFKGVLGLGKNVNTTNVWSWQNARGYVLSMEQNNYIAFQITGADGTAMLIDAPLAYNQWWHVAATLDGSSGSMKLYVDGALAAQTNTVIRPLGELDADEAPGVSIGNTYDDIYDLPFNGYIDQISLYSRALSAAEVGAIYNAGLAGKNYY